MQVDAVQRDGTGLGRVEAHDEVDYGGLTAATGADDADELAGLDAEGEVACAEVAATVVEGDVVEGQRGAGKGRHACASRLLRGISGRQDLGAGWFKGEGEKGIHFFGVDAGLLQVDLGAEKRLQDGVGAGKIGGEGDETAYGQPALNDLEGAVTEDEAGSDVVDGFGQDDADQFVEGRDPGFDASMFHEPVPPARFSKGRR